MERKMANDVAQIYDVWNEWIAACHADDIERFMALWIDGARQMAPDAPPYVGKEQIRAAMAPTFDLFSISNMVINTEEVRIEGDWAYSHGMYTFDMAPKGGGESMSLSGKFLDILARQDDGSWKIAIDCHNYNEAYG